VLHLALENGYAGLAHMFVERSTDMASQVNPYSLHVEYTLERFEPATFGDVAVKPLAR